jgi:enoyl-CoA hydratase
MTSVLVEKNGPVWTVVLNRPDKRNAVDPETAQALREAFDAFEWDAAALCAVLAGSGGTFCAGFDLTRVGDATSAYDPNGDGPMGPTRRTLSKPVIAAVEGYAVAGGLELALWCDLRVASETAVFGVFCRRWGVPLIDGGTVRLPRIVGQGRALDMILTGRPVKAEEALAWGLADRLVAAGQAREAAEALAHELTRFPQACMRTDRFSALQQGSEPTEEALRREAREGAGVLALGAAEGAGRFVGGRGRGGDFGAI